jgi:hypothetical protein
MHRQLKCIPLSRALQEGMTMLNTITSAAFGLAAMMAFTGSALADGTVADTGGYGTVGWVGESTEGVIGSSFDTFCLEAGADLGHLSADFHGTVSTTIESSVGYSESGMITGSALNHQTASLYSAFKSGSLSDVTGWGSDAEQARPPSGSLDLVDLGVVIGVVDIFPVDYPPVIVVPLPAEATMAGVGVLGLVGGRVVRRGRH